MPRSWSGTILEIFTPQNCKFAHSHLLPVNDDRLNRPPPVWSGLGVHTITCKSTVFELYTYIVGTLTLVLAQSKYFEDEAFMNYLEYLEYFRGREYSKFITSLQPSFTELMKVSNMSTYPHVVKTTWIPRCYHESRHCKESRRRNLWTFHQKYKRNQRNERRREYGRQHTDNDNDSLIIVW